ncbi:MAG: hypothetical protein E7258_02740 [Lachnospiraceae bacterium]|nr:hypothetical protein [Lachnospiraceae bacterium]
MKKKRNILLLILIICISAYVIWRIVDSRYPTITLKEEPKGIYTYSYDERLTVLYDDSIVIYDEYGNETEYEVDSDVVIADMYPVGDFAWVIDESKNLYKMSYLVEGKVQFSDVILMDIVDFTAVDDSFCAVTSDGELYVWGNNENCSLGIKNRECIDVPTKVDYMSDVVMVQINSGNTYVLKNDGTVYFSGQISVYDEIGEGYSKSVEEYVQITELNNIKSIEGNYEIQVINNDNEVISVLYMEFYGGTKEYKPKYYEEASTLCNEKNVTNFSSSSQFTVGVTNEGVAYLWGANFIEGMKGKADMDKIVYPKKIPRLDTVDDVYAAFGVVYAKKGLTIYIISGN